MKTIRLFCIALMLSFSAGATTYFVTPSGNSGNSGLSWAAPLDIVTAAGNFLTNGNVVLVTNGLYTSQVTISAGMGSAPNNPAILRSFNKWGAVISVGSGYGITTTYTPFVTNVMIDGFCVTNCGNVDNTGSHDGIGLTGIGLTVTNCWITWNNGQGINVSHPSNSLYVIRKNLIEYNGRNAFGLGGAVNAHLHGAYLSGPGGIVADNVVRYNCSGGGLQFYTGFGATVQNGTSIYNNLVYGHTNFFGIICWNAVDGGTLPGTNAVFGNTILDGLSLKYGQSLVANNIILCGGSSSTVPVTIPTGTALAANNLYTNSSAIAGPGDVSTTFANIAFVAPSRGLYWIQASSAARNAAIGSTFGPEDWFQNPQTSVSDIGAFQYKLIEQVDNRSLDPSPSFGADYWSSNTFWWTVTR